MKTPLFAAALLLLPALAGAEERRVLTVYTYDSFLSEWGPGPVVEPRFEAICGCDLVFRAAGDGAALLAQLRLEGARTRADVVLGLDTNLTAEAAATGLFAAHGMSPPLDVPVPWTDPLFLPFDWGYFAFVHDTDVLPVPPASFEALLAAPEEVTVIIQDPRTSTPGLGLLLWVEALHGERAGEVWRKLRPRIVTVTRGWSEAYGLFLEGEAAMVLSYTTSPAYHAMAEGDATIRAAAFAEGHYLQIEVAGMVAGTDVPDLARAFLAFMVTEDFQSAIPTTNWMYPAVFPEAGLPPAFRDLVTPAETLMIPPGEVPERRAKALAAWLAAVAE